MRRHAYVALLSLAVAATASACGNDDNTPTSPPTERFRATLDGAKERPTPRTTPATATADFTLRRDTLSWTIALSSITNVTAAHIHVGGPEVAGGIVLFLTPGTTGTNNSAISGFVTRGTFATPAAPNQGVTFDNLLDLMRSGGSYVNVHTNDPANDPTNNAGPGDFPAGEIRGQIAKVP
ncbi:MAG: CHRD domain-containing protein [Gemmatimonadaceae bacterium]